MKTARTWTKIGGSLTNREILGGKKMPNPSSEIVIYTSEDGSTRVDVHMENETVWLSQAQMAEHFQTRPQNITLHIKNIYLEGELGQDATRKECLQVQTEGSREVSRNTKSCNLDAIDYDPHSEDSLEGK
jgi:hypothetical protein